MTLDRRRFLALAASGLFAAPATALAQPAGRGSRIGLLGDGPLSHPGRPQLWAAFLKGLHDLGYAAARHTTTEHVSADGKYERLPALAADLVRHKSDVIVAPAAQNVVAAKQATQTIPIVMASVGDPVGNRLITSLARPGGNVTGTSFLT